MKRSDLQTVIPRARKKGIVVRELPDEVLIYDMLRFKAHCLNHAAASIWKQCNGRRTVEEIALKAGRELDSPVPPGAVWLAVSQLEKLHLFDGAVARPPRVARISRRDMIGRLGVSSALAIPVIMSMAAPTPAQVVSCRANGVSCTLNAQCCGGCCGGRSGSVLTGTCANTSGAAKGTNAGCTKGTQCCSGVCTGGLCTA